MRIPPRSNKTTSYLGTVYWNPFLILGFTYIHTHEKDDQQTLYKTERVYNVKIKVRNTYLRGNDIEFAIGL
jgi:hypothetical protein